MSEPIKQPSVDSDVTRRFVGIVNLVGSAASITGISLLVVRDKIPGAVSWMAIATLMCAFSMALATIAYAVYHLDRHMKTQPRYHKWVAWPVLVSVAVPLLFLLAGLFATAIRPALEFGVSLMAKAL
jgi:ABC-type molybdate transport system permease subunit